MIRIIYLLIFFIAIPAMAATLNDNRSFYIHGGYGGYNGAVQFIVTDPLGRKTGYDLITKQYYYEAPNQSYTEAGEEDSAFIYMSYINNFPDAIDGVYKIKAIGGMGMYYSIIIDVDSTISPLSILTFSYPGKVDYYEFNYNYAQAKAGVRPVFVRIITPSTLIDDINALYKPNNLDVNKNFAIGDAKFVSELIKEINEIEAERAKGKIDDGLTPAQKAKKEYQELLNEITEKYNKPENDEFVKKQAYRVLKEDLDYIISH